MSNDLHDTELLEVLSAVQVEYLLNPQPRRAFERILSQVLTLTKSEYGFIGEVLGTPEQPYLRTNSATNIAWNEATAALYADGHGEGMEFHNMRTLFGAVVKSARPVIANEPGSDHRRGGLPPGHPPLRAFMGLPFFAGPTLLGVIGLANRPGGYDEPLAARLAPVLTTCASLVSALRDRRSLQTTSSRLTALIQNLGAGLLVEDETRHIRLANGELLRLFGMPGEPDALVGMECDAAARAIADRFEDPQVFLETIAATLAARTIVRGTELALRDGRTFERDYIPIFSEATYRGHLWMYRDSTDRKANERALVRQSRDLTRTNGELERALRTKDEFLASMSHELRTPLVSVLGLSESLGEGIHGPLTARQQAAVRGIGESGRHLLDLINDVLELARADTEKSPLKLAPTHVGELCQESLRLVKESAARKRLRVSLSMTPAEITCVLDPRRVKQLLVNLLSNAVKFTPEGGQVRLEVEGDEVQSELRLAVVDSGIGIAKDELERIFEPFVQGERHASRELQGTGLGLAICRKLATLHGGTVSAESSACTGSRFVVQLPWVVVPPAAHAYTKSPSLAMPPPDAPLVLLAEDSAPSAEVIKTYLEAHGYRVAIAADGFTAVAQASAVTPALVLMDIQLPGIDGREATRRIRALPDPAQARVPIFALTALAMPGDRESCFEAGVDEYLTKPLVLADLVAHLDQRLRHSEPS